MYHKRDIPTTGYSKTEKLNTFYGKFVPDLYIYIIVLILQYYQDYITDKVN